MAVLTASTSGLANLSLRLSISGEKGGGSSPSSLAIVLQCPPPSDFLGQRLLSSCPGVCSLAMCSYRRQQGRRQQGRRHAASGSGTQEGPLGWRFLFDSSATPTVALRTCNGCQRRGGQVGVASAGTVAAVIALEQDGGVQSLPGVALEGGGIALLDPPPIQAEVPPSPLAVKQQQRRGGGGGGRKRVKSMSPSQAAASISGKENAGSDKLGWLTQEGVDLTSELIVDTDELCSRSSAGLLALQRSIWKVNRAISRAGSVREALNVIEQMKSAGMSAANEGTYVALITVCRRQQQGERALTVYEAMKQAGVKPGRLTFNTLISCCQQAQRLEDAFRLKVDMEAAGIQPDVVTYTSLMSLVVKANPYRGRSSPTQRLERTMNLFKEMQDKGVQADAVTFNTLMYAAAQAKLPGRVLEVYGSMVAAGVTPNQFTFGILLEAVGAAGRLKSAVQVFNEMKAAGVPPTTSIFNFMIDACGSAPQPDAEKAWQLLEEMKSTVDCQPNAETYANLITACCKAGRHEDAMRAYQMMLDGGFRKGITGATYNRLIHSAGMLGTAEQAFAMYDLMREAGYGPNAVTYSSLVSACTRESDLARALVASQEMEALGVKPNQVVFHALMGAYGNADQWQDAVATYRVMLEELKDEPPVASTFGILFDACCGRGGAEALVAERIASGQRLIITPGLRAALGLYDEAVRMGIFHNFSTDDISRCDIRGMSRSGTLISIVAWLEAVRQQPRVGDLMVVTGTDKGRGVLGQKRGRQPKLFLCAERALAALGLPMQIMKTLTMVALTVEAKALAAWLSSEETEASAIAVVEKSKRRRRRRRSKTGKAVSAGEDPSAGDDSGTASDSDQETVAVASVVGLTSIVSAKRDEDLNSSAT